MGALIPGVRRGHRFIVLAVLDARQLKLGILKWSLIADPACVGLRRGHVVMIFPFNRNGGSSILHFRLGVIQTINRVNWLQVALRARFVLVRPICYVCGCVHARGQL